MVATIAGGVRMLSLFLTFSFGRASNCSKKNPLARKDVRGLSKASCFPFCNNTAIAPNGNKFYMWAENSFDTVNVNERVIVSADDIAANGGGNWEVRVRSRDLATDTQSYSLVVTGPISPPVYTSGVEAAAVGEDTATGAAGPSAVTGSASLLLTAFSALAAVFLSA